MTVPIAQQPKWLRDALEAFNRPVGGALWLPVHVVPAILDVEEHFALERFHAFLSAICTPTPKGGPAA